MTNITDIVNILNEKEKDNLKNALYSLIENKYFNREITIETYNQVMKILYPI